MGSKVANFERECVPCTALQIKSLGIVACHMWGTSLPWYVGVHPELAIFSVERSCHWSCDDCWSGRKRRLAPCVFADSNSNFAVGSAHLELCVRRWHRGRWHRGSWHAPGSAACRMCWHCFCHGAGVCMLLHMLLLWRMLLLLRLLLLLHMVDGNAHCIHG